MDPASILVSALVAGAAAAVDEAAAVAVKDLYSAVKQFIQEKYAEVRLSRVEIDPADPKRQEALKQDIEDSGAYKDSELLARVNALLDAIELDKSATAAAHDIGIDIVDVRGAGLKLNDLAAEGDVRLKVAKSTFSKDVSIRGVRAGDGRNSRPN
jgi:hypothetical protein